MQPLDVKAERADRAAQIVAEKMRELTDPETMLLMIANEMRFYDFVYYDEDGNLTFDLTDLQMVGLAAAVAAVAEAGGYMAAEPLERNRIRFGVDRVLVPPPEKMNV